MISLLKRKFSTVLKETTLSNGIKLSVRHGDVTKEAVEAIVSNANSKLINDAGLAFNICE
jgi:hypothetical protein